LDDRTLLALTREAIEATRQTAARIVINDRLDIALATNASGVHLRGDSYAATRVRPIAPGGFLIGRSVHDVDQAVAAVAAGAAGVAGIDLFRSGAPLQATVSRLRRSFDT